MVLDSRGARDLTPRRRRILNEPEWEWIAERVEGEFDHVLLASSIPFVVSHGMHWLEAWVWQVVCSGLRKQLDPREKAAMKIVNSSFGRAVGKALARTVGIGESALNWALVERPRYVNQVATLELDGPAAHVRVETTAGADWRDPRLRPLFVRSLSGPPAVVDDR